MSAGRGIRQRQMPRHSRGSRRTRSWRPRSLGGAVEPDLQEPGGFAPQSDFRTVHLEDPRIAAGSAMPRGDADTGQKTEFHETASVLAGEVDVVEGGSIAAAQVYQGREGVLRLDVVATQLHLGSSMRESEMKVNIPVPLFIG